jgi:GNAT superfamily N-acetyltransferase
MDVTVADCERVQADWFTYRAKALGGRVWSDGPLDWTDGPDGINVMFPKSIEAAAIARGVEYARASGASIVGAWLSLGVDAAPLAEAGFERGWSPWWMAAGLDEVARPRGKSAEEPRDLPVIELQRDTVDFQGDSSYRSQLALTRLTPQRAWYAAAYAPASGAPTSGASAARRFAGRAWSFADGELAGVFDMNVWARFQRRGYGSALLRAVCASAETVGAVAGILNATPQGKPLYESCGFTQLGEGITWWLHLDRSREGRPGGTV